MSAPALDQYFISDASRIEGRVNQIMRVHGRVSALMKKEVLPDGIGFNFSTVVVNRSIGTGGGWVDVSAPDGTSNNCVPTPTTVAPSMSNLAYSAVQTSVLSNDICFQDARRSYNWPEQVKAIRENFSENIVDIWENEDKLLFFTNAGHKIVFDGSLTESTGATMPATPATSTINQNLLDDLYQQIIQDGGGKEAYASKQGSPIITAVMSQEAHRTIIKGDDSVREDFRWADSGKGDGSVLLQSWGIDRVYGGFMHCIDNKMPRFDFVGGAWVERPFYITQPSTVGDAAVVNPAYKNAEYEDIYLWHPDVVHRQVPKPLGSVGADTTGRAINFNGEVMWLNIPNKDTNPFGDIGFWGARLYAAYKPIKPQYGYCIRVKRCPRVATTSCPAY